MYKKQLKKKSKMCERARFFLKITSLIRVAVASLLPLLAFECNEFSYAFQ